MSILKPLVIFHDTTRLYYFSSNITYFWQKYPIKVQIFRFSTARVKIHQISHVIFQTKNEFLFKVWITLQCHERKLFCTFLAKTLYAIDKSSTSECKCSNLPVLTLKFTKFVMQFLKPWASFTSNFASLPSVMRDNFVWTFSSQTLCFQQKEPIKWKFSDFQLLAWKLTKFLVIFQTTFSLEFCINFQCHDS